MHPSAHAAHVRIALRIALAIASGVVVATGCGTSLPARYVIERDVGTFAYRRYQKVTDTEFPVAGNSAIGHTATYLKRGRAQHIGVLTAFVTVYQRDKGLVEAVRALVRSLDGYKVHVVDTEAGYAWSLKGSEGDVWLLWVSKNVVVKLGAEHEDVPEELIEAYGGLYESDLDERGRGPR